MTLASLLLLFLVILVLILDVVTLARSARKILVLEVLALLAAMVLIVRQDIATAVGRYVGLERGVDFVIYPMMVWLFREALMSRHARWVEARRLDRLVRAVAIRQAQVYEVARAPER
jgi:Uncharacterized conserved protein (DUF2304)